MPFVGWAGLPQGLWRPAGHGAAFPVMESVPPAAPERE